MNKPHVWKEEEIALLKENKLPFNDIAMKLHISASVVCKKAKELGIVHTRQFNGYCKWSQEQIDYLKENYPTKPLIDLAEVIGFSAPTIRRKAQELGLKRAENYDVKNFIRRHVNAYSGNAHRKQCNV